MNFMDGQELGSLQADDSDQRSARRGQLAQGNNVGHADHVKLQYSLFRAARGRLEPDSDFARPRLGVPWANLFTVWSLVLDLRRLAQSQENRCPNTRSFLIVGYAKTNVSCNEGRSAKYFSRVIDTLHMLLAKIRQSPPRLVTCSMEFTSFPACRVRDQHY
jgi:hypothetical protein